MDNSMWAELTDVFRKLNATYESAIKLGERKHEALVMVNMDSLSKILDEEQIMIAKIQRLERQRGGILTKMAKDEPSITAETKMEDFIKLAPNFAIERELRDLHKSLSERVAEAVRIRDNNQILAQGALDAVKYHLNRISGAAVEPTYSNKGGNFISHRKNFNYKA